MHTTSIKYESKKNICLFYERLEHDVKMPKRMVGTLNDDEAERAADNTASRKTHLFSVDFMLFLESTKCKLYSCPHAILHWRRTSFQNGCIELVQNTYPFMFA